MTIAVVLVRPETPQNIGAVARVMKNTGLRDLWLVDPGDWRTVETWRSAWGSHDILENARSFERVEEALLGTAIAVALSGRDDDVPVMDVREAAAEIACVASDRPAALVFGPETSGLTLAEMALCGRRATIPSHPDQPSFNLSHAVAITAYEVFRERRRAPIAAKAWMASFDERAALIDEMTSGLALIGALPKGKEIYARQFRAFMHRLDVSKAEARWLRHLAYCMNRVARHAGFDSSTVAKKP